MLSLTDATLLAQADDAVVILDKELVELYLMPFLPAISLEVSVKAKIFFLISHLIVEIQSYVDKIPRSDLIELMSGSGMSFEKSMSH